jgi:ABC-type sugar transport system permease subunit
VKGQGNQRVFIIVFLAPAFFLFTLFVAIPSVQALLYSLQHWDGFGQARWVGLHNFRVLFAESDLFVTALKHNLIITAGAGSMTLMLALLFAALIHRRIRGSRVFRVVFFFPNVIASVAIALLWVLLYSTTEFGLINQFLVLLNSHLHFMRPEALPFPFTDSRYVIYSIIPMVVWMATGFYMVLFLAAMETVPVTFYEAARLDGASEWTQFWQITFPMIREVFTVGLVFLVIGCMKFFDIVWVMENQWPAKESHVLATVLYQKVFSEYNVGYGSAVAVLLFLMVFAATLVVLRLSRREALEY